MTDCSIFSMVVLGILGSAHCIGMCGPLVLAFPARFGGVWMHLAYHAGRIGTYVLVGTVIGAFSRGVSHARPHDAHWIGWTQSGFATVAALFLIWFGLAKLGVIREPAWLNETDFLTSHGFQRLIRSMRHGNPLTMLGIGACTGLLPCGLSFAAFSRVMAFPSLTAAPLMMLAFGIGTLPALLFLGTGAARLARVWRRELELLTGMFLLGMGISLIGHLLF